MKRPSQKQSNFKVTLLPFETSVEVPAGTNLLEAIRTANLPLKATCGGQGTCGDCVVQVVRGDCKRKSSAALADRLFAQGFSLACLTEITEDLVVELPQFEELALEKAVDSKFFDEHRHRISGVFEVNPPLKKTGFSLPPPSLEASSSDLRRLERELQKRYPALRLDYEYSVLKKLAHAARKDQGKIWVILFKKRDAGIILDVGPQSTKKKVCGIACDVGTSTVALHLVELETGKILGTASSSNQQLKCGEDVISRIDYAQKPGHLEELHDLILRTINHLIEKVTKAAGILPSEIYYASVAGNTTMIHLFLNLDPRFIREEPYVPTFNQVPEVLAQEISLSINPEGRVFCSPAVGSYVGGDITAGLLATPLLRDSEKISLFIDAGTNGEIVVGNKEWLMTCACSAGPAFEGGGIRCGMSASDGAIEKIEIEEKGQIQYSIIDGAKPKGLCGSALVDLLAELFIHGIIDRYGKFRQRSAGGLIVKDESGLAFRIEQAENTYWGHDLLITESDIANLIRTKGAVFSACSTLLKKLGLRLEQIESFYIAGGFGKSLNVENAIRIGLLPDLERGKFYYLGNTSLLGAYLVLLSDKNKEIAQATAQKMTYIELNAEPKYMNEYTASLFLPHTDMRLFPSVEKIFSSKNSK
jgi:uncharacterized 2Fe-2S/4Fe-4S cluster protein (DUF4445 family)